jgi:hypothetical protein
MNTIYKSFIFFVFVLASFKVYSKPINNGIFQIRIYHLKNNEQVKATDHFLATAFLPALHRFGIKNIGVFKPIANDTATVKLIYVLIPFASTEQWMKINNRLNSDAVFKSSAGDFLDANAKNPAFERMESILLEPFSAHPGLTLPKQKNSERVFELRSYESPTEVLFEKKVAMFNTGGEIPIFNRLGFNPVFYGKVISGSRMPNLMYMPVFDNVQQKNEGWKKFGSDTTWKRISTDPKNQNDVNVNHIDSIMMHSTDYSDY